MLRDADPNSFAGIYIVCGYTDLRYGIDSLAAIIEQKYHLSLFVPNTLFLFCGKSASKIKGLLWFCFSFFVLCTALKTFPTFSETSSKLCTALFSSFCSPFNSTWLPLIQAYRYRHFDYLRLIRDSLFPAVLL